MNYDVVIIGASLAGSSLAYQLARSSLRVALVDKETFPRSKPCGEGLSNKGFSVLQDLKLDKSLKATDYCQLNGYQINYKGQALELRENFGVGLSRYLLDNLIIEKAKEFPNLDFYDACEVSEVKSGVDYKELKLSDSRILNCKKVILAAGAYSSIYRLFGIKTAPSVSKRYGASCSFYVGNNKSLDIVKIFLEPGYELLVTPVARDRVNVSLLANKTKLKLNPADILALMKKFLNQIGLNSEPLGLAESRVIYSGLKRKSYQGDGVCLLGDACEQLDPVGGMGMTHALLSSKLLSEALISCFANGTLEQEILRKYEQSHDQMIKAYRGFTRITYAMLVEHPSLFFNMPNLSNFMGPLMTRAVHGSGKRNLAEKIAYSTFEFCGARC